MSAPVLQFKRGNGIGVAGTVVPALRPGEPVFALNTFDFFIGTDKTISSLVLIVTREEKMELILLNSI